MLETATARTYYNTTTVWPAGRGRGWSRRGRRWEFLFILLAIV